MAVLRAKSVAGSTPVTGAYPGSGSHGYLAWLGLDSLNAGQIVRQVESGLSFKRLERFQQNIGLPMDTVADLVRIRPRTLARRKASGRLLPEESDRLVRASRVVGKAIDLFEGDTDSARTWLTSPQTALGGDVPLAIARTDVGAREVEDLIGRLEHGVFS